MVSLSRNEIINQICSSSNLQGQALENLRQTLSKMTIEQLQAELTKRLSGEQDSYNYGWEIEHTQTSSVVVLNNKNKTTYTDTNGNEVTEYKDGEALIERIIKHTDKNNNIIETVISYVQGKPSSVTKKKNGNTTESSKYKYKTTDEGVEFIEVTTTMSDKSQTTTFAFQADENGNIDDNDLISRTKTGINGTITTINKKYGLLNEEIIRTNGKIIENVYNGDDVEKYDSGNLNKYYQRTEENGIVRQIKYDGKGNTITTVNAGDSWGSLAQRYNVSEQAVRALNPQKKMLQAGQQVLIPGEFNADSAPLKRTQDPRVAILRGNQAELKRQQTQAYEATIKTKTISATGTFQNGSRLTFGANDKISIEDFVKNVLHLDTTQGVGQKVLSRLVQLPQEELNKISYTDFAAKQMGGMFAPKTNDFSNATFEEIAAALSIKSNVNIKTRDEMRDLSSPKEKEKQELRTAAADNIALAYDNAINLIKQYQGNQGWLNVGFYREKLGQLLSKVNPTGINTCFEDVIKELEEQRDFAVSYLNSNSNNDSDFKAAFRRITGGAEYNEENMKAFLNVAQDEKADFNNDKYNEKFWNSYNKAFGIAKTDKKGNIYYEPQVVKEATSRINFQQYVDGAGDIVLMLLGTEALGKGVAWAGGKVLSKTGKYVPKFMSNLSSKTVMTIGNNNVTLGRVAGSMASQSATFTMWDASKNYINLKTKDIQYTGEAAIQEWQAYKDGNVESAKFGAFAGLLNSTVVGKVINSTMKTFEKPMAKAMSKVGKSFEKTSTMSGADVMKTFIQNQTPGFIAHTAGLVTEIAGFTLYETANEITNELLQPDENGERHLPKELTEDGLTSYLCDRLVGQATNLGEIKAISRLIFMHKGAIKEQTRMLDENLAKCETLKNLKVTRTEINGQEFFEISKPDGTREMVNSPEEVVVKCHVLMQLDMALNAKNEMENYAGIDVGKFNNIVNELQAQIKDLPSIPAKLNKVFSYLQNPKNMSQLFNPDCTWAEGCERNSQAFALICKELGLEGVETKTGIYTDAFGRAEEHMWTEVTIDGKTLIYDLAQKQALPKDWSPNPAKQAGYKEGEVTSPKSVKDKTSVENQTETETQKGAGVNEGVKPDTPEGGVEIKNAVISPDAEGGYKVKIGEQEFKAKTLEEATEIVNKNAPKDATVEFENITTKEDLMSSDADTKVATETQNGKVEANPIRELSDAEFEALKLKLQKNPNYRLVIPEGLDEYAVTRETAQIVDLVLKTPELLNNKNITTKLIDCLLNTNTHEQTQLLFELLKKPELFEKLSADDLLSLVSNTFDEAKLEVALYVTKNSFLFEMKDFSDIVGIHNNEDAILRKQLIDLLGNIKENNPLLWNNSNFKNNVIKSIEGVNSVEQFEIAKKIIENNCFWEDENISNNISTFIFCIETPEQFELAKCLTNEIFASDDNMHVYSTILSNSRNHDYYQNVKQTLCFCDEMLQKYPELWQDAKMSFLGEMLRSNNLTEQMKIKEQVISCLDEMVKNNPELLNNKNFTKQIGRIIQATDTPEKAKIKQEVINKTLSNEKLYNKEIVMNNIAYIIENTNTPESVILVDKIFSDEKLYNNKNLMNNLGDILVATNEHNIALAERLCTDKELNFPKEYIGDIIRATDDKNITLAEKLCTDKELDFPKEYIQHLLRVDCHELILKRLDNPRFVKDITDMYKTDVNSVSSFFVQLYAFTGKNVLAEFTKSEKRELIQILLENKKNITGRRGYVNEIQKERIPILPTNTEEYVLIMKKLANSMNISLEPVSTKQTAQFNKVIDELSHYLKEADLSNLEEINLTIPHTEFISRVESVIKHLPKEEQAKIQDFYGFKIIDGKLSGYPNLDTKDLNLSDITDKQSIIAVNQLKTLIDDYINNNFVTVKDNPSLNRLLKELSKVLPEIFNQIDGSKSSVGMIKSLQKIVKNSDFENLSESDKRVIIVATLLHNTDKISGSTKESSFDAYFISKKFNITDEDAQKICSIIEASDFVEEFMNTHKRPTEVNIRAAIIGQEREDKFDLMAFKLKEGNNYELAKMLYSSKYQEGFTRHFDKILSDRIQQMKTNDFILPQTPIETYLSHAQQKTITRAGNSYNVQVVESKDIKDFYAIIHTPEAGFATGGTRGANFANFDAFAVLNDDKVICTSYVSNDLAGLVNEYHNGFIFDVANDKQYVGYGEDIYSLAKNIPDMIVEYYRDRGFQANGGRGAKHQHRRMISNVLKSILYGKDYYNMSINVDAEITTIREKYKAQIDDISLKRKAYILQKFGTDNITLEQFKTLKQDERFIEIENQIKLLKKQQADEIQSIPKYADLEEMDRLYADRLDEVKLKLGNRTMSLENIEKIDPEFAKAYREFLQRNGSEHTGEASLLRSGWHNEVLVSNPKISAIFTDNIENIPEEYLIKAQEEDLPIVIIR